MSVFRGFALIEVSIVLIVLAVSAALAMPLYSNWAVSSRYSGIHDDAQILLVALGEYYHRHCKVVPFPQPTVAVLKSQQLLIHEPYQNADGGQWLLSVSGVGSTTPVASVTLPFNQATVASAVASRGRHAVLSGNHVVWSRSLLRPHDSGEVGMNGLNLFSGGCN